MSDHSPSDVVVHLEVVLGAEVMIWESGRASVLPWDDTTAGDSPAARDLAIFAGVDA